MVHMYKRAETFGRVTEGRNIYAAIFFSVHYVEQNRIQ